MLRRKELEDFRLKCVNAMSHFKKKLIHDGDDEQIRRLLTLTSKIDEELRSLDSDEDEKIVDALYHEYEKLDTSASQSLIESVQIELNNMDKDMWYATNFDNWRGMPERQECDDYPVSERLRYSQCRVKMFDHLEHEWKQTTFPTLASRLEFF